MLDLKILRDKTLKFYSNLKNNTFLRWMTIAYYHRYYPVKADYFITIPVVVIIHC